MRTVERIFKHLLLFISALIILFPLLYAFSISLTETGQLINTSKLFSSITLENYGLALQSVPILKFIWNSFIFASSITVGHLITSSLAAFAFVFISFRGKGMLFLVVLSTMMIPWEATIIPNYDTVIKLGWLNTFPGLIVPHLASTLGIFLLRQHFLTLPKELYEAARIDGCSRFRFFWRMVIPLSRPILAALGTYSFITNWNQYLWPLLVTNSDGIRTVQIGLNMLISQEQQNAFPVVMAGIIMVLSPS